MSLARATIGLNRVFESIATGRPGRRGILVGLTVFSGVLIIAAGLILLLNPRLFTPLVGIAGLLATIFVFTLLVVRHEWVFLLGIIAGHTVFYGRFPNELGMRIRGSVGPGDVLFVLALVASIVYWFGQRERPTVPKSIVWPPIVFYVFTAAYLMVSFFIWRRQDIALLQVVGWLYFVLVLPAYLCFATGRMWKPFFIVVFTALLAGAILASAIEANVLSNIVTRLGYGGLGARSFGDLTVRTHQLGMAVSGLMLSLVVLGFARTWFWKYASLIGALGAATIVYLDRGRATYAGMAFALLLVAVFVPNTPRFRALLRLAASLIVAVLIIQLVGGKLQDRFNATVEKAATAISLTSKDAIMADTGITLRLRLLRQAQAVFNSNPLLGGGPGVRFGYRFNAIAGESEPITFIDNSWMYPLAVGGIVGMSLMVACYVGFVAVCVSSWLRLRNWLHKSLALVPLGQIVWLLSCSHVNWWMLDAFHVAFLSITVGMVVALVHHEKVNGSDVPIVNF